MSHSEGQKSVVRTPTKGIVHGVLQLFVGGLVGKLLGIMREALLAFLFGTGEVVAANRVAQAAVLAPMNLLTTDALSGAFLPLESNLVRERADRAIALYRLVQVTFVAAGLLFIPVALVLGDSWIGFIAPGLNASTTELAVTMFVVMSLGVPSYLHYNIICYLDLAHGGYRLTSWRSSGQSIGMIAGTVAAFAFGRPALMAWGFVAAYMMLSAIGMYFCHRRGYLLGRTAKWRVRGAGGTFGVFCRRLRILILIPIISQAQVVTEKIVASQLGVDAVAAVDYARLVTDTGILLVAMPVGLASLSSFSLISESEFRPRLLKVIAPFLVVSLALGAYIASFSREIVSALFERGAFGSQSSQTTSSILAGLGMGMAAQFLSYVLLRVLTARARIWSTIAITATSAVVVIASRSLLVQHFGAAGLGLAVAAGAVTSAVGALLMCGLFTCIAIRCALLSPALALTLFTGHLMGNGARWELPIILCLSLAGWIVTIWCVPVLRNDMIQLVRALRGSVIDP